MKIVLLDKNLHNRKAFDCGVEAINNYLKLMANQQSKRDNARTYILVDNENSSEILGFYTLSLIKIEFPLEYKNLEKKHNLGIAGLIARLGVDKKHKNKGYGKILLADALKRLLKASDIVGFPMVIVDAKDGLEEFYLKFGFKKFIQNSNRLFITIESVRKSMP